MKGLTLTQPYATLVALLAKLIETRSWRTNYRGPLAIHAGKGLGPVDGTLGLAALCSVEPFWSVLHGAGYHRSDQLPRGCIVAVAFLAGCDRTDILQALQPRRFTDLAGRVWEFPLSDQERAFGDYSPGRYGWLMASVRPLREPVPCRGAQGLWDVPTEVQAKIHEQLFGPAKEARP